MRELGWAYRHHLDRDEPGRRPLLQPTRTPSSGSRRAKPPPTRTWLSCHRFQQRVFKTGGRLIRHSRSFILQTGRKLLDTDPLRAHRRAQRTTRVAPDLIARAGPGGSGCEAGDPGGSVSEAGGQQRQALEHSRSAALTPRERCEWAEWVAGRPAAYSATRRGRKTCSISEIPAQRWFGTPSLRRRSRGVTSG